MTKNRIRGLSLCVLLPAAGSCLWRDAEAAQTAIVSCAGSGEVAFIDIQAAEVSASVKLPNRASFPIALAATPDGSSVVVACETGYVSFLGAGGVTTRELHEGPEQIGLTTIQNEFSGVTLTPDGGMALVTEANGQGQLFRFDVATRELVGAPWNCGDDPSKIVVTPDGLTAYMLDHNGAGNSLQVVNLLNGACTSFPLPGAEFGSFELVPTDTSRALFTNSGDDQIVLLDTTTWQPLNQPPLDIAPGREAEPSALAISPDGTLAIVANYADQSITFVAVSNSYPYLTVGTTIPVGGSGGGVAFSPDGQTAVVTLVNTSLVKIIDVVNQRVRATVSAGLGLIPTGVTVVAQMPPWAMDGDADGFVAAVDCNNTSASVWDRPSEVRTLRFAADKRTMNWLAPTSLGGTSVSYDALRSGTPNDFQAAATCVATGIGATTTTDVNVPTTGLRFFYLVRANNACPNGRGPLGFASSGGEVLGGVCP
jgi:DNA-binding beta-propeller fold protein YncE